MSCARSWALRCLMANFTAVTSRVRSSGRSNCGGRAMASTTAGSRARMQLQGQIPVLKLDGGASLKTHSAAMKGCQRAAFKRGKLY